MAAKTANRHRTPNRRKPNPSFSRRRESNPGGALTGMIMNGVWVGLGMYAGGIVSGFTAPILGSITGSLGILGGIAQGILNAYLVGWLANHTIGHGELMAAGAFGATIPSILGGVLGGAGNLVSSVTGAISGGAANATQGQQQGGGASPPTVPLPQGAAPQTGLPAGLPPGYTPAQVSGSGQPNWQGSAMPSHTFGDMDGMEDSDGYNMKGAAN